MRLKKKEFALPEKQVSAMPFMVTQASSVMMSSPSLRTCMKTSYVLPGIADAAFPGLSNQKIVADFDPAHSIDYSRAQTLSHVQRGSVVLSMQHFLSQGAGPISDLRSPIRLQKT